MGHSAHVLPKNIQKKWTPPCMDEKIITAYPHCIPRPGAGTNGKCSIFIALGCHGFYPSSDAAKKELLRTSEQLK